MCVLIIIIFFLVVGIFSPTFAAAMYLGVIQVKVLRQQSLSCVHSIYHCHAVCEQPSVKGAWSVLARWGEQDEEGGLGGGGRRGLVGGAEEKGRAEVVGGGESYNSRGQNFDPIDVLREAAQLKPKPSYMSDFVNYSEHWLLTPR